jgi:hypothetical protein
MVGSPMDLLVVERCVDSFSFVVPTADEFEDRVGTRSESIDS